MRVVFSCLPGFGHLQPMVPLATACLRSGHDVLVATGQDLTSRVAAFGLAAAAVGPTRAEGERLAERGPDDAAETALRRIWDNYTFVHRLPTTAATIRAADLVPLVQDWKPDLVVHDVTDFAAPFAAARAGVPSALHSWGPPFPEKVMARAGAKAAALWEDAGLPAPLTGGMHRGLYLDICPPSLWPDDAGRLPRVQPLRAAEIAEPWSGPSVALDGMPYDTTVHVTLGTVANRSLDTFRIVMTELRDEPLNLVVTIGSDQDPAVFGDQPDNVVVASYIPIDLILPRCQAVIAHGGSGTMLAALRHGLPQLLLPYDGDNVRNARLCQAAGVALQLSPRELDGAALRAGVRRLVEEPGFLSSARRVRDEMTAMPAPDEVVPVLERLAAGNIGSGEG
jgi:UDP:flavonoid glycosyltransferase YjiC (YdhE family)